MIRLLTGFLIFALTGEIATSQQNAAAVMEQKSSSPQSIAEESDKSDLLQRISMNEKAARSFEAAHADNNRLARIYDDLGNLYIDAGMYLKAQDAMKRAIALLKSGPQDELADVFAQLAVLHVEMGKIAEAKRDEMRALQIREVVGDPVAMAFTWKDMAGLFALERKPKEAAGYAQKAYDVLADRSDVGADDRIAVRESLGFTLTTVRNCERGIPILKDAIELSKSTYGVDSRNQGYAEYLLGFGYWHCHDRDQAAAWFERGTTLMKADFGWDRDLYLNSMKNYARFLRENGQVEAAISAEAVVHQAEALVDAQTLSGTTEGFRSAAPQ